MLVVVLLLPLSLARDNGEFDHGGDGGGGGGLEAAAAAAVAAVDDGWRRKRPATRASGGHGRGRGHGGVGGGGGGYDRGAMAALAALRWVGAVAVAVAVARVSPPFQCAPASALLPIPFFKSSN
jgi:hypothetical protein